MSARAIVHPDFDPMYYGFYIEGLRRIFGASSVIPGMGPFPGQAARSSSNKLAMRFVVQANGRSARLAIEADDMTRFDPVTVDWADAVGKVNYVDEAVPPALAGRVHAIGPSFGVTAWSGIDLARWTTAALQAPLSLARRQQLLGLYLRQRYTRVSETRYRSSTSRTDYQFFIAKGWLRHAEVNPPRLAFIRRCRALEGLRFEGGFVPTKEGSPPELTPFLAARAYRTEEYVQRTAESLLAFNTPAVHGCLGWKLGEFFALGKAIVSLPLARVMPEPLIPGEHIHFVSGDPDELTAAIKRLRRDHVYRMRLETQARSYYDRYLAPEAVMSRFLKIVGMLN